jgi:hypothetical protein
MADLGSPLIFEIDASNQSAVPDGWPEGQNPSTVNNCARANVGADKRFWVRTNSVFTTGGASTAYTLTYAQAASAYYDGEEFSFIVNATCGAAPTLNINGLGARQIRKFVVGLFMNLVAGDLAANQQIRVRYNLAATTFDIISGGPTTWTQNVVTAATIDFSGIPTTINNLQLDLRLLNSTVGGSLYLQFFSSTGAPDTGSHYYYDLFSFNTASSIGGANPATGVVLTGLLGSSSNNVAASANVWINSIQSVSVQANWLVNYLLNNNITPTGSWGFGAYGPAFGPITGIRVGITAGTLTGLLSLRSTNP